MIIDFEEFINERNHRGDEAFKRLVQEIKANFNPDHLITETAINPGKFVRYNIDDRRAIEIRFWWKELLIINIHSKTLAFFDAMILDRERDDTFGYWLERWGHDDDPDNKNQEIRPIPAGEIHDVSQYLIRDLCKFFFDQKKKYLGQESWFKRLYHKLFGYPPNKIVNAEVDPYGEENWDEK